MSQTPNDTTESFSEIELPPAAPDELLTVAVDGFEGPLDLLLSLARNQKVDLAKISILMLAEQYLVFIESAKRMNLELAADYLVMAAWLAYLKSRLLLPPPHEVEGEPSASEMAMRLRWRLSRLEYIRDVSARLMARNRLDRDVFARGAPEPVAVVKRALYVDSLYDLLTAYAGGRGKKFKGGSYTLPNPPVIQIEEARIRLERMVGKIPDWNGFLNLMPTEWAGGTRRVSAIASMLLACLELTRDGRMEMRQLAPFEEIFVKDRARAAT
ncbi:MAG: ScpA family protein [Rhizomicrobium sp.]